MLMNAPATFIQSYIDDLNDALNQLKPGAALIRIQAAWLGTCLTCILLMNSGCWAKFERASLGDCKVAALSWVFRKASIPWDWLLRVSVVLILKRYGITEQARHATSRNSGTPVAVIRSPTQRIGDAPAALRPPQTEHKAAQSWLPQMALRLFGIKF
ncbi:hypothetical protein [Bathymodiolus japonicus methanotrophic gill symbiont]|uniref:hypothetical protein n=1 Tax=Bathymodiolus japonicus methanotrophic gill symbiont TaxID=113269 RepID=UPI001C8DE008|nr:hypothetical protein [Bathymodiolus japonicus methanotrophic gill symbiont]